MLLFFVVVVAMVVVVGGVVAVVLLLELHPTDKIPGYMTGISATVVEYKPVCRAG